MLLFECDDLPPLRWCGYCKQPYAATLENFAHHKYGRLGLQTVCRCCANADRALRKRFERLYPKPELCPSCGAAVPLQIDHCHETGEFRSWLCRSCNLAHRVPYKVGPTKACSSDE